MVKLDDERGISNILYHYDSNTVWLHLETFCPLIRPRLRPFFCFLILPKRCSIMLIQNCKNFGSSKKLIPGTNILLHPLFPRPGYARLPGQRYNHRHSCDHYHQHHHDHRRPSRHPHPHRHPDQNQITCGGWDTERRGSGVSRRLPALSTLKKDDVYELADDDDDVVGSDDNRDEDDHDVDERNLQGWSWLPSQITWRNWTDREGTPIS